MDDPLGRVDKVMDELLKTNPRFQQYRPQLCPHFTHIDQFYTTITINNFFKANKNIVQEEILLNTTSDLISGSFLN